MTKEFDFINKIRNQFDLKKIGDDCAVLPKNKTHDLLISADLLVEDIDFRRSWMIPEFIGHKALAVSLSDIAAMGGKPLYSMLSIGIPKDIWQTDFVDEFYEGYFKLAKLFDVELIGGDVSKTPDKIIIDSIILGEVKHGNAILRSGAKVGDLIFVTGELGGASGGLDLLENNFDFQNSVMWQQILITKQLKPMPELEKSKRLGFTRIPTSMIDISDGLSSDLMHICEASQVGAKIFADKIRIAPYLDKITSSSNSPLDYALNGGEDYNLLFTTNPQNYFSKKSFFQKQGSYHIGEITANVGIIELISESKTTILEAKGYQHF